MDQHRDDVSSLDMDVVASLRELGGEQEPGLFDELVGLFIQESDNQLANLREAARQSAFQKVEIIAHTLKSSSANLGALGMAEICTQLERSVRSGEAERVGSLCDRVQAIYLEVRQDLDSLRR